MNDDNKKIELKTKKFEKEVTIKDGKETKKFKVRIAEGQKLDIEKKDRDNDKDTKFDAKIVEIDKDGKGDLDKDGKDAKVDVTYKKGTWWPYFEVKKIDDKDVSETGKTTIPVQGHKYWWPTLTLIIGGAVIGVALTGLLIWSLFKKDGDEE